MEKGEPMLDYHVKACPWHSTWEYSGPQIAGRFAHICEECAKLFAADLERQVEEEADQRRVAELAYFELTGKLVDYTEFWAERVKRKA